MNSLGPILALLFIVVVARLLLRKYHPHAVLLIAGLLMLALALILQFPVPEPMKSTGSEGLDLFRLLKESFAGTNAKVGLMIMSIGGFVAYSDAIGASKALVRIAMKPLSLLGKHPHATAAAVIPIGQLLFVCIPSAAGLGLLLMASIFPILVNLGVSRLSAVSVITACTAFGIGPASAITASAVSLVEDNSIEFFLGHQIPLVLPLSLIVAVAYYFVNRYFDRKNPEEAENTAASEESNSEAEEKKAPRIYALIPVLPLILLVVFSDFFQIFSKPIVLDTTTAMFISLFIALLFEFIRQRKLKPVLDSLKTFWNGMGNIFKTVVTLIIAADIFSQGLIAMGFIDGLLYASQNLGFEAIGVGIVMTVMIFLASMLMGSGNAAFFDYAPLLHEIAKQFGVKASQMILPMNLAASMGRTVSPVAGVLIATADIAGVSTLQIVKRNLIPLGLALVVMLIYHFI